MDDRKAKLAELKSRRDAKQSGDKPTITFRNYEPKSADLKEAKIENAEVAPLPTLEEVLPQKKPEEEEVLNVAPKKPNWDLKRDVAAQLAILEKRTKRAIVELTRKRIMEEENSGDTLASAVEHAEMKTNKTSRTA